MFDSGGHCGQRMERVQEIFRHVGMCRFAYTTYAKALIELRTYARGIPFEGLEGFLIKMQTLDDTIVDFTPPLPKRCVQEYRTQFVYQPIHTHCYADGRHRPLMSVGYWSKQDKRTVGVVSPPITYSVRIMARPRRKRRRRQPAQKQRKHWVGGGSPGSILKAAAKLGQARQGQTV